MVPLYKLFIIVVPSFLILFIFNDRAYSQSCGGGTYWCGNVESYCHFKNSSDFCDPITDNNCICESQCVDRTNGTCSSRPSQATCDNPCANYPCQVSGTSCSWSSGPAPTSPPGGGSGSTCDPTQTTTTATYNECGAFGGDPNSSCTVRKFTYDDPDCDQTDQFEQVGSCTTCSNGCSGGVCINPTNTPIPTTPPGVPTNTPAPPTPTLSCGPPNNRSAGTSCTCDSQCTSNWCNGGFCNASTPTATTAPSCPLPYNRSSGASCTCNSQCSNGWCNGGFCNTPPTATKGPTPTTPPPCTSNSPSCKHVCAGTSCDLVAG